MANFLKITGKILYGIVVTAAVFIICIGVIFISEKHYGNKLREAKPGIPLAEIQKQWGVEDREYNIDTHTKAIFYDRGFLGSSFVFILDKEDNTLLRTFWDD